MSWSTTACRSRAPKKARFISVLWRPHDRIWRRPAVQRTCAAADRTGHAILHTLYGQSLKNNAEFYIEYFAIDLIMSEDGSVQGVFAWKLDDGTMHVFNAKMVVLATGGYGRAYFSAHLRPHLHRRRRRHGRASGSRFAGHGVCSVPPDRHLRLWLL